MLRMITPRLLLLFSVCACVSIVLLLHSFNWLQPREQQDFHSRMQRVAGRDVRAQRLSQRLHHP